MVPMADIELLEQVQEASNRLVRTVDGMTDEQYAEPSALPGWSRAHVVAHLALNGEGLAAALRGVVAGEPVPMYASPEDRDGDIEVGAGSEPGELRERLLASVTKFAAALTAVPDDALGTRVERTPGALSFAAGAVPGMRLREVEIHHVDLALGARHSEWSESFATRVIEAMMKRHGSEPDQPLTLHASDLDRTWHSGDGGATVSGTAADLAWWLTGRGSGEGLTSDAGALPEAEAW